MLRNPKSGCSVVKKNYFWWYTAGKCHLYAFGDGNTSYISTSASQSQVILVWHGNTSNCNQWVWQSNQHWAWQFLKRLLFKSQSWMSSITLVHCTPNPISFKYGKLYSTQFVGRNGEPSRGGSLQAARSLLSSIWSQSRETVVIYKSSQVNVNTIW